MKEFFRQIGNLNWIAAILLSLLALAMWVPDFIGESVGGTLPTISTLVLSLCNGLVLMVVVYYSGVSRTLSGTPVFLYLLLTGSQPIMHTCWKIQIVLLLCLLALLLVFSVYHRNNAVHESFLCAILLSFAGLLLPDIIILIPFAWFAFMWQRAFSSKVWFASLVGIFTVGLYTTLVWWIGWIDICPPSALIERDVLTLLPLNTGAAYLLLAFLGTVFMLTAFYRFRRANSTMQSYVVLNAVPFVIFSILMFFPLSDFPSTFILAAAGYSALASKVFITQSSVFIGILFLLNIIAWPIVYLLQLFIF